MAIYTIGSSGATVVGRDGKPLCRLAPGQTIVPGIIDTAEEYAAYVERAIETDAEAKRVAGYRDKRVRVANTKAAGS